MGEDTAMTSVDGFKLDKDSAASRRPGVGMRYPRPNQDIRDEMARHALDQCRPHVEEYVACTRDKTLSGIFLCRSLLHKMQDCMSKYENDDEFKRRVIEAGRPWKDEHR